MASMPSAQVNFCKNVYCLGNSFKSLSNPKIFVLYCLEFLELEIVYIILTLRLMFSCPGYEELTAGPAGVDYSKGYNNSSQAQAKSAASGPGKGKKKKHTLSNILIRIFEVVWNYNMYMLLLLFC